MIEPGDFSVEPPAQPPTTILPDEPHPRAPREWSAYIAWTIIILISGFLMIAAAKPDSVVFKVRRGIRTFFVELETGWR